MNNRDVQAKIDYEGGYFEAICGYGLDGNDADDPVVADLLDRIAAKGDEIHALIAKLENYFSEYADKHPDEYEEDPEDE